jgi:hypothetical protein
LERSLDFLGDVTLSTVEPFSDFTTFIGAIATASNTETAGSIVFPDSAMAVATTRELTNSTSGCSTAPQVIYPPLFGGGSSTDVSSADVQAEIQDVDDAREIAIRTVNAAFTGSQGKDANTAGNSLLNTELTDANGLYDSLMNSILQVNSSTGIIGSASIVQGSQLARLLSGFPDPKTQKPSKPRAFILLATVVSAGGTEHDHKNFWRSLGPGDQISYSGGIIVTVSLWRAPGADPDPKPGATEGAANADGATSNSKQSKNAMGSQPTSAPTVDTGNAPIYSDVLMSRMGFTKFKTPKGKSIGDDFGNNLAQTLEPRQPSPQSQDNGGQPVQPKP